MDIDVYYNPNSMATVLSLSNVADLASVKITMDTLKERAILVHLNDKIIKFQECNDGLYYFDTAALLDQTVEVTYKQNIRDYFYLQTVAESNRFYSKEEI